MSLIGLKLSGRPSFFLEARKENPYLCCSALLDSWPYSLALAPHPFTFKAGKIAPPSLSCAHLVSWGSHWDSWCKEKVFACMHTHVCVHVCCVCSTYMFMLVCVSLHVKTAINTPVFLSHSPPYFWDMISQWIWTPRSLSVSLHPGLELYTCTAPCLKLYISSEIQTWILGFAQQVLYQLSHLPRHSCGHL